MSSFRILAVDTERVWRGGQQQIFTLIQGIASDHEVRLAAPAAAPLAERVRALKIPVTDFGQRNEFSPLAFFRLLSLISGWKPQIIHFNTPKPILMGCLAARFRRPRPACVASRRVVFPLSSSLSRFKYSHLLDLTLTVSESIRELLIGAGVPPSRVKTVHEGVELPAEERKSKNRESARLTVGTVAHLSQEKGQETLILAAKELQEEFPDVRFVIVGEGAERAHLEALTRELGIQDQVEFWGFRADADSLNRQFDIFTLPSLSEGLSSAILAAMAAGRPVVATQVGGNQELVESGVNGFVVPPGDPVGLASTLRRLLQSRRLREEMGKAGRRRVKEQFTLEAKIARTLEAYSELIGARRFR